MLQLRYISMICLFSNKCVFRVNRTRHLLNHGPMCIFKNSNSVAFSGVSFYRSSLVFYGLMHVMRNNVNSIRIVMYTGFMFQAVDTEHEILHSFSDTDHERILYKYYTKHHIWIVGAWYSFCWYEYQLVPWQECRKWQHYSLEAQRECADWVYTCALLQTETKYEAWTEYDWW